ncbi:hypothetical protein CLV58_113130 [Spirosoma oryzae]|uniref:Double-GTPase 2 domain-containing protein n=1 Tax=Spirosoma oryzae TaxID=1469603 RepID=A0A2T0SRG6_9BACT|nr:hypothetical protein [Spirosoma oryzae]PRY35999.1 hypothetical protein CLV58_113130 [Spirosoma oryzae]
MAGNCEVDSCYPDEFGCNNEGCEVLKDCPHYKPAQKTAGEQVPQTDADEFFIRAPWTGNAMGLKDLEYLASLNQLTVIGITGAASAGKTTFLATLYCLLRQGATVGQYRFAGSLTLTGWENIAWYLSWKEDNSIEFPEHTTSNAGRVPGLLHLKLRDKNNRTKDLIFTDAPGEWFDHWAFNEKDPNAAGALWIHTIADAFLLFADCDMLASNQLGKARKQTRMVADRIKQGINNRPFALIWSKSDVTLDPDIKAQISTYITNSPISQYKEFETSVREGRKGEYHANVCASIAWVLSMLDRDLNESPVVISKKPEDMFLSIR